MATEKCEKQNIELFNLAAILSAASLERIPRNFITVWRLFAPAGCKMAEPVGDRVCPVNLGEKWFIFKKGFREQVNQKGMDQGMPEEPGTFLDHGGLWITEFVVSEMGVLEKV